MLRCLLLVGLDHMRSKDPPMSLGVASIVANLRKHGVPHRAVSANVAAPDFSLAPVLAAALSAEFNSPRADVVVGVFVWNELYVQELLATLRAEGYRGRIGLAGPQISYANKGTLEHLYPRADYFIRGYAEDALVAITSHPNTSAPTQNTHTPTAPRLTHRTSVSALRAGGAPASVRTASSASVRPAPRPETLRFHRAREERVWAPPPPPPRPAPIPGVHYAGDEDVGAQGTPDFSALPSPFLAGVLAPTAFMRWETQRGCPFRCSFCQHKAAGGGVFRYTLRRVMQEIELFCADPVGRHAEIAVVDPTFNTDTQHAVSVLDAFRGGGFRGRLELQVRPEKISVPFLEAAARLGRDHVTLEMGIQSAVPDELSMIQRIPGSDPIRTCAKVEEKLKFVASYGLNSEISLIFGLPLQTVASFKESIAWCRRVLPGARVRAFPLMLLRGTALEQEKEELGLVEGSAEHIVTERLQNFIPHVVQTPSMSREDWEEMADLARGLEEEVY